MVPLAQALVSAGHEVAFAVPDSFSSRPRNAGFPTIAVGLDRGEISAEVARRFPDRASVPQERLLHFALTNIGVGIVAPAMVTDLVAAVEDWGADLLVHGPSLFAGPLAAAVTGIPCANHGWGPLVLDELRMATGAMTPLWQEWSIPFEPDAGMFRYLYLDVCPPSLQAPELVTAEVAHPLRPSPADPIGEERLPDWVHTLPAAPTVYVTLGTFCNSFTGVFSAILKGLHDQQVNVVVTVGYDQDPASLGPQPGHVHVVRYVPVSLLLPHCRVVVSHGGSGTLLAALSQGLPVLLVPQGHDQMKNAERCGVAGVGRSLGPGQLNPDAIRHEVTTLLRDPSYAGAAQRVQHEIQSMPGPTEAVALLERLAAERRPLVRSGQ